MEDPEVRRKYSDSGKKQMADPELRKKYSDDGKKRMVDPEVRRKLSEAGKKQFADPEIRKKWSEAGKKQYADPELRKRLSDEKKQPYNDPEIRRKWSEAGKKRFENPESRMRAVELGLGGFWYGNVRYHYGPQYCEKWTAELRERVRAYFGYTCVWCGTPQNEKKLSVHHVHYNKKLCCDDTPRTLVPLCASCHTLTTKGDRDYWSEYFQEIIDTYYEGKCWFTKEEMKKHKSSNTQ